MNTQIGQPLRRLDGPAKVTGQARYAADTPIRDVLHAVLVGASQPHGRIVSIDTSAARHSPRVVHLFTHENAPRF